jgi:flagellar hook-basal body complex protein FliE
MDPINQNMRIEPANNIFGDSLHETSSSGGEGDSFGKMLNGLVDQVDALQKNADASIHGLVSGDETNVHNVAIKMEEASVAFDLMMQVRNKLLEAYQEISKMQT